ncbi:UDP-Glycosyltransferase/glycogen phosphorylase [Lentinus tigrinus ALCF2SS1-7]|uniref:UDP-Glycosyltransferase/glycogen phosphorylase n=1 Tax=Lentinus tigrinus ALCF2SS1-7 TaxID=1328758 RepID=UPI0011660FBE|nr:UDP-Glycosyltransferase/glycogen phosphorylase [Lentinus tigrinus ALCF2SS1-7]
MAANPAKHLVVFPMQMWGHTRSVCTLVARMVKMRPVTVTFFTAASVYERVKAEIARDFEPGQEVSTSHIRLVALESGTDPHDMKTIQVAFAAALEKLLADQPVVCVKTGTSYDPPAVRPSAVMVDSFLYFGFQAARKHRDVVKVYAWFASSTSVFFGIFAQDLQSLAEEEAARRGVSFETAAFDLVTPLEGKVIRTPCTPPMHDYEFHPQNFPFVPAFVANVLVKATRVVREADGLVTFDAADYCPEAARAVRAWFAERKRKVCYAGPLIPHGKNAEANELKQSQQSDKIVKFLKEKLVSHGEKSVIYVSFGSLFWPTDDAKLWAVLETIMEKNIPFVMSCAAEFFRPPEGMEDKLSAYGNAIVSKWVPQQALLEHPATGWFLSHGGLNGTMETIMAGIPLIVYPIDADQPVNAIHLSESLDIAYELIEVRNGKGAGPIYRNGRVPVGTIEAVKSEMRDVLERAFGEDGAQKRTRLEALRKTLQSAWSEEGVAKRDVEALVDEI